MTAHADARRPGPRTAARAAGALVLTTALVAGPFAVAPVSPAAAVPDSVSIEAPGSGADAPGLGGSGAPPDLAASQEGSWFLGRSVDSILGPGQWYEAPEGRTWYGAYRTLPGRFSYCTDAGLRTPHPRFFDQDGDGEAIETARTAWALGAHRESDSAATHAALSAMVRLDDAIPHRHAIAPGHPKDLGDDFAAAARTFETLTRDAARYAGPYTLEVDIRDRTFRAMSAEESEDTVGEDAAGGTSAEAGAPDRIEPAVFGLDVVVTLVSASGHSVPGHAVDLTATGAELVDDRITTGDDPTVVSFTAARGSTIAVEATVDDLPADHVLLHRPRGAGSDRVQAVVTPGAPVSLTAEDSLERTQEKPEIPSPPPPPSPTPTPSQLPPEPTASPTAPRPSPVPLPTTTPTLMPSASPEPSPPPEATTPPAPTTPPPPPPSTTPSETPEASAPPRTPTPPQPSDVPETTEAPTPPEETEAPPPEDTEVPAPPQSAPPEDALEPPAPPESAPPEAPIPPQDPSPPEGPSPAPSTLPRTGVDASAAAGLALALVAVGVGALTLARRR